MQCLLSSKSISITVRLIVDHTSRVSLKDKLEENVTEAINCSAMTLVVVPVLLKMKCIVK